MFATAFLSGFAFYATVLIIVFRLSGRIKYSLWKFGVLVFSNDENHCPKMVLEDFVILLPELETFSCDGSRLHSNMKSFTSFTQSFVLIVRTKTG